MVAVARWIVAHMAYPAEIPADIKENEASPEVCKTWVRNDFVKSRVGEMMRAERLNARDIHFLGGLCTGGSADPQKRDFKVVVKGDGLLVAFCGGAKDSNQFGLQSCIYSNPKNANIMQCFHFATPFRASALRCRTVRDFLERNVPRWSTLRSMPDNRMQDFLTKRAHGNDSFFRVEGTVTSRSTDDSLDLRFRRTDAELIASHLRQSGSATLQGMKGEIVNFRGCVVNGYPGFSIDLKSGSVARRSLVSHGLYSVILEVGSKDGTYVTGLRSLGKVVSLSMFKGENQPVSIASTFVDPAKAKERIREMGLITNRPIRKGSDFERIANLFGIRYSKAAEARRYLFSAHGSSNAMAVLRLMGIPEESTRGMMKAGLSDEAIHDCLLAARVVAGCGGTGVRLLNAPGFTSSVVDGFRMGGDAKVEFEFQQGDDRVTAHIVPASHLPQCFDKMAEPYEGPTTPCVVFCKDGMAFALYAKGGMRVNPSVLSGAKGDRPAMQDHGNDLRSAVARLCYIVGACRSDPQLASFEHTMRSVWLCTERNRPSLRGNVHDICILSMVGSNGSDSLHYSVLPYL